MASSPTLRQGEADMVAHINALHRLLGRSWSQVFELFRLMELLYGDTPFAPSAVRPIWAPPETVNVEARTEEARAQKDTGVPVEFIWRHVWGYTEKEVDAMQKALAALASQTENNGGATTDAAPGNAADGSTASAAANGRSATTAKPSEYSGIIKKDFYAHGITEPRTEAKQQIQTAADPTSHHQAAGRLQQSCCRRHRTR